MTSLDKLNGARYVYSFLVAASPSVKTISLNRNFHLLYVLIYARRIFIVFYFDLSYTRLLSYFLIRRYWVRPKYALIYHIVYFGVKYLYDPHSDGVDISYTSVDILSDSSSQNLSKLGSIYRKLSWQNVPLTINVCGKPSYAAILRSPADPGWVLFRILRNEKFAIIRHIKRAQIVTRQEWRR